MGPVLYTPEQTPAVLEKIERMAKACVDWHASGAFDLALPWGGTPEAEAACDHVFGDRVYARGVWLPAGTLLVSRVHKQARIVVIAAGECAFNDGQIAIRVQAPWVGGLSAGLKTAVYAITDCYWVACFGTEIKDNADVFDMLTCATFEDYAAYLRGSQ
jgi:hypothetical protein